MSSAMDVLHCSVHGAPGVGKASLIHRFCRLATLPSGDAARPVSVVGRVPIMAVFSSRSLSSATCTGAVDDTWSDVIVLVYDICDATSLDLLLAWATVSRLPTSAVVLVGNKADAAAGRAVPTHRGMEAAIQHGWCFVETSAADGTNVDCAFYSVCAVEGVHAPRPRCRATSRAAIMERSLCRLGFQDAVAAEAVARLQPLSAVGGLQAIDLASVISWAPGQWVSDVETAATVSTPSETVAALCKLGVHASVAERAASHGGTSQQMLDLSQALTWAGL